MGFEIILALSQAVGGLRLAEISHVIGSPVSSVQTALRKLMLNELVRKSVTVPPRYTLVPDHPARAALVSTATVIADSARSIGILLRASPAVGWAAIDGGGFLVGLEPSPPPGALEILGRHLRMIEESRPGGPAVDLLPLPDLERLARIELELRARTRRALTIKGRAPGASSGADDERGRRAG